MIVITATVAAALAFKVNKAGINSYCYLQTWIQPFIGECTNMVDFASARPLNPWEIPVYYTTTYSIAGCDFANCMELGVPDQW